MNKNGNDYGKLSELQLEKDSKENDLLEKMSYWEYLSTLENQYQKIYDEIKNKKLIQIKLGGDEFGKAILRFSTTHFR